MIPKNHPDFDNLTYAVRGCIFEVHKTLGPGLFESAYIPCLAYELEKAGLKVETLKHLPFLYKGQRIDVGYVLKVVVEDTVLIEVRSVKALDDVDKKRTLTYLKLSGLPIGFLVNFNEASLVPKENFIRIIN